MPVGAYPRLVAASGLSNLADGAFTIALPLVALSMTRDPKVLAAVTFVGRLPWLLVALPAGALADRLDRRRTMTLVNAGRALAIGALAGILLVEAPTLWMLYVMAFALGVGETLFDTAAQSIVPSIVEPDLLERANGRLYATELVSNQFVGPPLGALIAGATLAGALGTSALLYALAAATLITISGQFRPRRSERTTTLTADVREGIAYLARHRLLRNMAICVGISNLASTAMIVILPLYAIAPGPVGLNAAGYGLLLTTFAIGSVLGTTLVEPIQRRLGARRALLLATAGFPLFGLAPAITTSVPILAAAFVVAGAISIGWNVITVSLRQRVVPDQLLGRVNAGYRLVAWGTMPLGAALGGAAASAFGLTTAFAVSAAISSACFVIVLVGIGADDLATADGRPALSRPVPTGTQDR